MIIGYLDGPVLWETNSQKNREINLAWDTHEAHKLAEIKRRSFMRQFVPAEYKGMYPHLGRRR